MTKARAFIKQTMDEIHKRVKDEKQPIRITPPEIICTSIEKINSLVAATHAYSFWEGIPMSARASFGRLFKSSATCKAVTVVQRSMRDPAGQMFELGFGRLILITSFAVKMSGSGASFQAYIFSKPSPMAMSAFPSGRSSLGGGSPLPSALEADENVKEEEKEGLIERGTKRRRVEFTSNEKAVVPKPTVLPLPFRSTRSSSRLDLKHKR